MAHRSDYDSAWKDALDAYFPQFMALLWPAMHAEIDWRHPPVFLDKELQAMVRSAARGRRHVDKLASVRLREGQDTLVLIHIEIQAGHDRDFAQRMYAYHVRLREKRPQHPLVNLAVLTGRNGNGVGSGNSHGNRSDGICRASYVYEYWGCSLAFTFPVMHLESWRSCTAVLLEQAPSNPFAVVVLAQLEANATRDGRTRLVRKTELVRHLYHWKFSRDNVIQLFRIIDAMLGLPEALEPAFEDAIIQIEEESQMTYVTSIERVRLKRERAQGVEEGLQQGQLKGAAEVLATQITRKFGALPDWARVRMSKADETALNRWALQILDAQRIEDVFA